VGRRDAEKSDNSTDAERSQGSTISSAGYVSKTSGGLPSEPRKTFAFERPLGPVQSNDFNGQKFCKVIRRKDALGGRQQIFPLCGWVIPPDARPYGKY